MNHKSIHAVTGAFGYSGRYIATRLLAAGHEVITLTNSPPPCPAGNERPENLAVSREASGPLARLKDIPVHPLAFAEPDRLAASLAGVEVLYNTYWVRFNHGSFSHAQAIQNTRTLFAAAKRAGVRRMVHVSITNPRADSPLEYFAGKARLEQALAESGMEYSILRPTVLFGREDILINNIAWALRRFPCFAVFGDGKYRLQPIGVEDLADLAIAEGRQSGRRIINAIGPETFTYRELVTAAGNAIGKRRRIVAVSPGIGYAASRLIGWWVKDIFITREEIQGLMDGLLYVDAPPAGRTRLTDWMQAHATTLGTRYASELGRRTTGGCNKKILNHE